MKKGMKKIIFVDDDPDIQEIIRLVFENAGYEVDVYGKGAPLLEYRYDPPDIIILDKQLPDIDGLDICRRLKRNEKTKDIPVIMLSANPDIKTLGANAGAEESVEKPFNIKFLKKLIAKYTDG